MRTFLLSSSTVLLAVAVLSSLLISEQAAPASQKDILARSLGMGDRTLPAYSAFEGALQISGVPGGVAFMEGCSDQPLPVVHPHGTTLRDVLDSITSGDSDYVWRLHKGVVTLEPSQGVPALLRIHLKTYDSRNFTDAVSAVTFLSSSPEVIRAATKLGLAHNVSGSALGSMAQGSTPPQKPLGIRLQDVPLMEALNVIARTNKHGVWRYRETHCGSVHQFDISFAQ
jgi:hypothetical protein